MTTELRTKIFKSISTPISLVLTNRGWHETSKDPDVRAEWLIYKYGKSHALFHALRLGKSFITSTEVIQALLEKDITISRYFMQRLLMHFGKHDERLVELRTEHNANQVRIHALPRPWANGLPVQIFNELLIEGERILNNEKFLLKGNDMELFHFLSAGPFPIDSAHQRFLQNINEIEDLILNKKFIPFPPRPKLIYEDTVEYNQLAQTRSHENYPPIDGYENTRQLNVIARAILIYPGLVILWKKIGYYEICNDINELVMQGVLLTLFPPTQPDNWTCPNVDDIVDRLMTLVNLGFQLTDDVMEEAFHLFEHRLNEIGNLLLNSFQVIRKESKSVTACSCLIRAIRPERNHKKTNLLEFYISKIDQPQEALKNALEHYNVGFNFDANSIKSVIKIRSLSVCSNFYYWVLKKFGIKSEITQECFEDILESRIWVDLKLQETPRLNVPENLTKLAFNSICSIYLEFCNERIPFKANYLPYLQLANNEEIIKPFFEINLPIVFGLRPKYNLPYEINHYPYERPEVNSSKNNKNNERKLVDNQLNMDEWFENMYFDQNNSNITEIFKNHFKEFLEFYKFDIDKWSFG